MTGGTLWIEIEEHGISSCGNERTVTRKAPFRQSKLSEFMPDPHEVTIQPEHFSFLEGDEEE